MLYMHSNFLQTLLLYVHMHVHVWVVHEMFCCAGNDARYNKQKQSLTTLLNVVQ